MAISTYAELRTAVENWVKRADLDDRIPEFIALAESRIARKLRIREMEASADVSITGGTRTASLPTGFREIKRLYLNASPITFLEYMTPQDYWSRYAATNQGKPVVFTIEGSDFVFGPIPDSSYTAKALYYKALDALASSVHGVFTANPDLYLYGALVATEPYLKNDKRFPLWKAQFDEIMAELNEQGRKIPGPTRMRDDYNPY